MKKTRPEPDQIKAFKVAAKEAGCDTSEAAFDLALGKIGKAKAATPQKPKPKAAKGK